MNTLDTRTVLSNALLEIRRLRERVDELEAAQKEPIAIVGMGCRLPGGVKNPESFWDALERGVDGISQPSADRWGLQDAQTTVQWAGLLDGVDQFDPLFFGVSPREAVTMDPQQRLFLQVAIEALESAGALLPQLEGSRTGVYVGLCNNDYTQLLLNDPAQIDTHAATGVLSCVLPGRLAYLLGLRGPNLVVDTGCSASLVAVHLAVRSLRGRETDLALAGAVNLVLSGSWNEIPSRLQAFAKDGHCKTFDANADGTVRGEGCGVVVLKRLADAVRDGDPIRAVIRGTAVNQDGRSTSLTSPNVLSQQAVIREALADANVSPERVGYVETHGTGTALGDPIEFEALNATYGVARQSGQLCALGALKTNIGHLEAAAGIAGLIKAVCCLEHGQIPQNLHFRSLNPRMSLAGTPFVLPSEKGGLQWGGPEPRVAGVSSFGIGGTNAHVIVEQAPRTEPKPETGAGHVLLLMSAKTETSLGQLAQQWETLLADTSKPPSALAAASARCRTHYAWRLAISGSSVEQLREALRAAMDSDRIVRPAVEQPKVAFVFQGLGGQWANMARRLVEQEPVFRQTMQQCDEAVRSNVGWSVLDKLSDVDSLSEHSFVQPILFSIQASLAALLDSWGIRPQAVVGHSAGEIAAAYVAGALSLEDAVEVVCRRSELHSLLGRSEERRVGKECRSRWAPYH